MSGILRFRIQVDPPPEADPLPGWQVSISLPQKGNLPVGQARRLRRLESSKAVDFPMPPEAEPLPALIQDEEGEPTPGELEKLFTAVNGRRVEAAEMRQYGRYLFDTLIGPNWQAILKAAAAEAIIPKDAADAAPGEDILIELALRWAIDDHALHRLHWEAMHNGQRFLIALNYDTSQADKANGNPEEPLVPVTITRLVPSAGPEPKPVTAPVRMLFALGASLTDPQVRPAAEFVGLLHQLKLKNVQFHTRTRLVENISPSMLSQAAGEFKPHVLHLISHGNVDREGRPYLELAVDDDENEKERKPAYGSDLVKRLGANKPVAAVLSACYTSGLGGKVGEIMSGAATAPMAAQLVAGGIPIVVGMSGQVADKACRLFSRGFAGALMSGTPLLMATVIGRLAAFMEDSPSQSWVDWASRLFSWVTTSRWISPCSIRRKKVLTVSWMNGQTG
jgi:hypothetical protein